MALFPAHSHPASQPANRACGALQIALGTINPPKLDLGRISASNPNRTKRAQTALAARATPAKQSPQGPLRVGEKTLRPFPPPPRGRSRAALLPALAAQPPAASKASTDAPKPRRNRQCAPGRPTATARPPGPKPIQKRGRLAAAGLHLKLNRRMPFPKFGFGLENRQNEWADAYSSWRARMPKRCLPIRPMLFCREKRFEPPKLGFDFLISTYCLSCYIIIFERDCLIKFQVERMACFNSLHRAFRENGAAFRKIIFGNTKTNR